MYINAAISLAMMASSATDKKTRRGSRTDVPWWWIQYAERWHRDHGTAKSNAELGAQLATALGRTDPFSYATIGRFWSGEIPTDQIAKGLLKLYPDLPPFAVYPGGRVHFMYVQDE